MTLPCPLAPCGRGQGEGTEKQKVNSRPILSRRRAAFSLLELLAVVTIMGVMAVIIIPRIGGHTLVAKKNACNQYVSDINSAIERYYFDTGAWPTSLDELSPDYYPEAIPNCPVVNAPYALDAATYRVADHPHP